MDIKLFKRCRKKSKYFSMEAMKKIQVKVYEKKVCITIKKRLYIKKRFTKNCFKFAKTDNAKVSFSNFKMRIFKATENGKRSINLHRNR